MSEEKPPERPTADTIRTAAMKGEIVFDADHIANKLDEEIQEIYLVLRKLQKKPYPKRPIWVADSADLSTGFDHEGGTRESEGNLAILAELEKELGIPLTLRTKWVDAALALRSKKGKVVLS